MNNPERARIFNAALRAMADFHLAFGRPLDSSIVAEFYVAYALHLKFPARRLEAGYDLIDNNGLRYQVKHRGQQTGNVDLNSFNFDYLILLHLDGEYQPHGLWKLTVAAAKEIFVPRAKFRRWQASQKEVRAHAASLQTPPWVLILPV